MFNQRIDRLLAKYLFVYVVNGQLIGPTKNFCWNSYRRWGSTCSWLGIQDASRRVQTPSQAPGPWAGTLTNTEGGVHRLVLQEMWDTTRRLIAFMVGMEKEGRDGMPRARMESIRGFLVYVYRTYSYMTPYLKGVHLNLYIWRPYMYEDGWRLRGESLNMAEVEGWW